jgi:hypothetical protein
VLIEKYQVDRINPAKYNPRVISPEELSGLKESIRKFGLVENLIVNKRTNTLVSGHQRFRAGCELGLTEFPVYEVDLSPTEEKALNIALNSQFISGKYDEELLTSLLTEIKLDFPEFNDLRFDEFDLKVDNEGLTDPNDVPEAPENPVSRLGDLWLLDPYYECEKCKKRYTFDEGKMMTGCPCD